MGRGGREGIPPLPPSKIFNRIPCVCLKTAAVFNLFEQVKHFNEMSNMTRGSSFILSFNVCINMIKIMISGKSPKSN